MTRDGETTLSRRWSIWDSVTSALVYLAHLAWFVATGLLLWTAFSPTPDVREGGREVPRSTHHDPRPAVDYEAFGT